MTIKEIRQTTGLSQKQFAERYHLSKRQIESWEQGRRKVPKFILWALTILTGNDREHTGLYQCFHCGCQSVVWGADFDFSDFGYDGEGIVHTCTCANCGAEIEYRIAFDEEEE